MKLEKGNSYYKELISTFDKNEVDMLVDNFSEMAGWIKDTTDEQLIMYVGSYYKHKELPVAEKYINEHYPDLLESPLLFKIMSDLSYDELKSRGYSSYNEMMNIFYENIGHSERMGDPSSPNKSDAHFEENDDEEYYEDEGFEEEQPKLTKWQKFYSIVLFLCLCFWGIRGIIWIYEKFF